MMGDRGEGLKEVAKLERTEETGSVFSYRDDVTS